MRISDCGIVKREEEYRTGNVGLRREKGEGRSRKLKGQRWNVELRIADLKKELPKHESRNCNLTLIITGLLGLQFEIRNSNFTIVDSRLSHDEVRVLYPRFFLLLVYCCCAIRNSIFAIACLSLLCNPPFAFRNSQLQLALISVSP